MYSHILHWVIILVLAELLNANRQVYSWWRTIVFKLNGCIYARIRLMHLYLDIIYIYIFSFGYKVCRIEHIYIYISKFLILFLSFSLSRRCKSWPKFRVKKSIIKVLKDGKIKKFIRKVSNCNHKCQQQRDKICKKCAKKII